MSPAVVGEDGIARCDWGVSTPEYQRYHDEEWGRPVGDDRLIYEKLCLEGFQSGLSWLTILRKREGFRSAFASFDPVVVAGFGDDDVERLVLDASIVRNRAKILATINNARATVELHEKGLSLGGLLWQHEPKKKRNPRTDPDVPPFTPESKALSALLMKNGFRFVGPTTAYAAMQSLGVVNDHFATCHFRKICESDRSEFTRPD
jgi:DNA-3-methyladenine glycosylase I